jgi:hypothetical protein
MIGYLFVLMLLALMESFYFLGKSHFLFEIKFPFGWKKKNIIEKIAVKKRSRN